MDDWGKFSETQVPKKEDFYSNINIEDFTDADYGHAKSFCKRFWNEKYRRISWFVCSKWHFLVSGCIGEL